jgi:hypothetical protein
MLSNILQRHCDVDRIAAARSLPASLIVGSIFILLTPAHEALCFARS